MSCISYLWIVYVCLSTSICRSIYDTLHFHITLTSFTPNQVLLRINILSKWQVLSQENLYLCKYPG
jgi:hypothetical protein